MAHWAGCKMERAMELYHGHGITQKRRNTTAEGGGINTKTTATASTNTPARASTSRQQREGGDRGNERRLALWARHCNVGKGEGDGDGERSATP